MKQLEILQLARKDTQENRVVVFIYSNDLIRSWELDAFSDSQKKKKIALWLGVIYWFV